MSKRNRNKFRTRENSSHSAEGVSHASNAVPASSHGHAAEYRIISSDLIRLVVLNALMLALVLVIYFTNLHSGYLEKIFMKLFKI